MWAIVETPYIKPNCQLLKAPYSPFMKSLGAFVAAKLSERAAGVGAVGLRHRVGDN